MAVNMILPHAEPCRWYFQYPHLLLRDGLNFRGECGELRRPRHSGSGAPFLPSDASLYGLLTADLLR